jgi:ABC-type lipoprotein export system ATPase subunit
LADEPTASLDDDAALDAVNLLLGTARHQGTTLVIATHDARVAAALVLTGQDIYQIGLKAPGYVLDQL